MRLKSALRRGVAAAVIAGIVVSSGIPAYAAPWNIADGDITVKAGDTEGTNWVSQGEKEDVKDTDTVITGESDKNTVTIDTSKGDVDVTFDDLKIDVSGKTEVDGSGDGSTRESNAAVTVQGGGDATIELDGDNKLKSGSNNAGLEKNKQESKGTLTIKDDKGKDGSLTAEGGEGGAGIGGGAERTGSNITIRGGTIEAVGGKVDVTFDDLKIDVSGKKEGDGSDDSPVDAGKAAVTVQGGGDATIELDGDNKLKSGSGNAGLEKNKHESKGTLTIKDDKGKDGSLTAEGGDDGAGIGGGIGSTGGSITIRGGTIEAVGGSNAAGIGDGAGPWSEPDPDIPPSNPSNPNNIIICGDAEVTAKAGSQMTDAKAPAIGGKYGEVPTENLSDDEHKVTGGRLTRLNADGTVMEGMGYDYTSTPTPQPDDDDDAPPPAQENAPEPLPGGMVVGGFFSSRVTIRRLDPAGVAESGIVPVFGSVKAADARADLTPGDVVLIESAAPRSTITTDIPSLREDGVEDIFFRYEDTLTHYSVDKIADAAGEDADVELKQNREDISLRLDGETRDDLSERYQEWVPVQTPEPQERLILTHEGVEQKTSEELRREREEARRELDESLRQERIFQIEKRDDLPSLDWWLEPAREETPGMLDESLKQLASRFEDIAPEEDKKPLLFLVDPPHTERKKYTNPLESDLRRYTDLSDDWDDQPDTQGEIKIWIPEDLGHLISPSKESLSRIDGIA